MPTGVDWL